jgi:hypothetical protein
MSVLACLIAETRPQADAVLELNKLSKTSVAAGSNSVERTMTRLQSCAVVVGALALAGVLAGEASAQRRDRDNWEQLGCEDVGRRPDRDIIKVGRREGRFKAIRLSASGNDVRVEDLKVVYANGRPDDIRVRREVREGSDTGPLDLKGRDRAISQIELITKRDFKGRGKGRAKVCVSGLEDDRRGDRRDDRRGDRRDNR